MERDDDRTGADRGPDTSPGRGGGPEQPVRDWADEMQPGPTRRAKATLLIVVSLAMLAALVLCCFALADVVEALNPFF